MTGWFEVIIIFDYEGYGGITRVIIRQLFFTGLRG